MLGGRLSCAFAGLTTLGRYPDEHEKIKTNTFYHRSPMGESYRHSPRPAPSSPPLARAVHVLSPLLPNPRRPSPQPVASSRVAPLPLCAQAHARTFAAHTHSDVVERLKPVILELERQRESVLVVAHRSIVRALYVGSCPPQPPPTAVACADATPSQIGAAECTTQDVPLKMYHKRCTTQDVPLKMQHARCTTPDATRQMQHARCNTPDATRQMQRRTTRLQQVLLLRRLPEGGDLQPRYPDQHGTYRRGNFRPAGPAASPERCALR